MPLIDWFTVVAQVLNFLVLVWLLKRFLYRPILHAIDAREERIAGELADADAKKAEARKEQEEFKRKNEEFDRQRASLLSKAKDEAKVERQQLLEEARKAASDLSAKQQEALKNAWQSSNEAIIRRTQQGVFAVARKALQDLAGTGLEERMVGVFIKKLHELTDEEKNRFTSASGASSNPLLVRTAFELPKTQRTLIESEVRGTFGVEAEIKFEVSPDLVSGIELSADGQKVAWSIAEYLTSLERGINEVLEQQTRPEIKTRLGSRPGPETGTEREDLESGPEFKPEPDSEPKLKKPVPEPEKRVDRNGT